jgi:hypothetical protein
MLELLLYSQMACADADALLFRIKANKSELSPQVVVELVETVKESVPECDFYWDAHD